MEFEELLQDVIRCDLCETPVPSRHCDICEECEEERIPQESKEHVIVSFDLRESTHKCSKHSTEICTQYCEQCDTPICTLCVCSGIHEHHKIEDISKMANGKKSPRNTDLQTGTKGITLKIVLEFIPAICISIINYSVKYFLFLSVLPGWKIHLWLIVIFLDAILTLCLVDFLCFCLKHVCGIDFAPSHFFEYLKCLMTRILKPRKFNLQTATKFTPLKKVFKLIILFICITYFEYGVRFFLIFSIVPGQKIHLWLIVIVLNVIILFCLIHLLLFCLKPVCGIDFIDVGFLLEYLKWLMTRIKELRKNDSQTTTNVILPELSGKGFIVYVCFNVIFSLVVSCLGFIIFQVFLFSVKAPA